VARATYADVVADLPSTSEPAAPLRVVVVEDEALIRMDLVEMLSEAGYVVVGATGNARDGVTLVAEHAPDAVLLDITMPLAASEDPDPSAGLVAARQISRDSGAAVVMLTAHGQATIAASAAEAGALAYLVKPVSAAEVVATITVAVNQRRALQQAQDHAARLETKVQAHEAVQRAVEMLMGAVGWTEPQAYAWLRKAAMDRRVTLTEAALAVVESPPGDM